MKDYAELLHYRSLMLSLASDWVRFGTISSQYDAELKSARLSKVDLSKLTDEQLINLGFGKPSQNNPMRLIPSWAAHKICPNTICQSLNGLTAPFSVFAEEPAIGAFLSVGIKDYQTVTK